MTNYEISESILEVLTYTEGIAETLHAVHTAMEKNNEEYADSIFLLKCVTDDQCRKMRKILDDLEETK